MLSDADLVRIARDLAATPGVVAVALGGSRARGTHSPDSDVDLGIYVDGRKFDRAALSAAVSRWATTPVTVGPAGSWGPWVDSGAWATIADTPVDVIIRDVDRVRAQVTRADFDVRVAAALDALDASPPGVRAAVEMFRALPHPS